MKKRSLLKTLIFFFAFCSHMPLAMADIGHGSGDALLVDYSSSSTTTTTGIVVIGGAGLSTSTFFGAKKSVSMKSYLRNNATALQQDIHMGAGNTITDLAQMFSVESKHKAAFGKLLRTNKSTLLSVLKSHNLTHKEAHTFTLTIIKAMKKDKRYQSSLEKLSSAS